MTPEIKQPKKLADHFTIFRRAAQLDQLTPEKALFIQNSFLAGASAVFQILHAASELPTKEEAALVWSDTWKEIQGAAPAPDPVRKEPSLIIRPN